MDATQECAYCNKLAVGKFKVTTGYDGYTCEDYLCEQCKESLSNAEDYVSIERIDD